MGFEMNEYVYCQYCLSVRLNFHYCILLILSILALSRLDLPDVGGNIIISRSIPNSLINLRLGSTSTFELVCLGLSVYQRLLLELRVVDLQVLT